jgi:hypothetical protein
LKLTKFDAFIRWSLKWFGWPTGFVEPHQFVVQNSVTVQDEPPLSDEPSQNI